ncbi:MAG TPA: adenylate/guanylate cyclase domain-containing protein [Syntrophales bacterium]|nr:adenylate/guanylate cyclase domain-containing protein [Syntrophales bacterium]
MKCPHCQFKNREGAKFCKECGRKLELQCTQCGATNQASSKFCDSCGQRLDEPDKEVKAVPAPEGERKHVTVLFSDISGYTAMSAKLDPEEVKEIMGHVLEGLNKVISQYEGFMEKYIGDAVMALFGVPSAQEDDPVRAIKAAFDIHAVVKSLSKQYEEKIGGPLAMHSGICTGLVVTGDINLEKGTHGVLGDTINTAFRLSSLAKPGELIVDTDTYRRATGNFNFETMKPATVNGKTEPVRIFRVLSPKEKPTKTHRLSGMRSELIGRKVEMAQLQEAIHNLKQGKGAVFSIIGEAGTGKSRLVEEFKATLRSEDIHWREGHCYPYGQNIPYFPLVNLLSRAWQVREGDTVDIVRQKVEAGANDLIGDRKDLIPYVGSLYSLKYPEIEGVNPDFWKARLHEAAKRIFTASIPRIGPMVICVEDLHWADPSFVELMHHVLADFRYPALVLCTYRPSFSLFTAQQVNGLGKLYQEIRLYDLSGSEAQDMLESLLKTERIPTDLMRFIQTKVERNPFHLEEVVNSLIESGTLVRDERGWNLVRPLKEADIPPTIQGIITARLDRLDEKAKRVLQEAAVIGRAFLYEILGRITKLKEPIDRPLSSLERQDLIRIKALQPDMEYIFKHALTQEVVYSGILKRERRVIHERIGGIMEQLFHDRLPEFYETLAFHFRRGTSVLKAVDYLMKSGEKSLKRYTLDESHQYYKEAFELLSAKTGKSKEEKLLLLDLILKWAVVYHHRAVYNELEEFLKVHEDFAVSLGDKARLGMLYVRLGGALEYRDKLKEAYEYSYKGLKLGEESGDQNVIGYGLAFLTFACADLGRLDEAIAFAERLQQIKVYKTDPDVYRISSTALGMAYFARGEARKARELGRAFIDYGRKQFYVGCITDGYLVLVWSHAAAGDFPAAIECALEAIRDFALEPAASLAIKVMLGYAYVGNEQYEEADRVLQEITKFDETHGYEKIGTAAQGFNSVITIIKGDLQKGIDQMEEVREVLLVNDSKYRIIHSYYLLARVYLQIAQGGGKKDISFLAKNIGFLIKTVPFASQRAEENFRKAIEVAKEIGAKGLLGQCYLDLGQLYKIRKKPEQARKYMTNAAQLFEECEADVFLKQTKEALATLGG